MPGPRRVQMNREQGGLSAQGTLGKAAVMTGGATREPQRARPVRTRPKEGSCLPTFHLRPTSSQRNLRWATGEGTRCQRSDLPPCFAKRKTRQITNKSRNRVSDTGRGRGVGGQPLCAAHAPERDTIRELPLWHPLGMELSRRCGRI